MINRLLAVVAAATLFSFPVQAQDASVPVLRPGDALRVTVWRRPDLTGEFAVGADGRLVHPILQRAVVAGVPRAEVNTRLTELLRGFEGATDFAIEPLIRVGVGGEVRQPGLFLVTTDLTVAGMVARAGGPTERGRLDRATLVRGSQTIEIDLLDPADQRTNMPVQSGDRISISRKRDVFREYIGPIASVIGAVAALVRITRN